MIKEPSQRNEDEPMGIGQPDILNHTAPAMTGGVGEPAVVAHSLKRERTAGIEPSNSEPSNRSGADCLLLIGSKSDAPQTPISNIIPSKSANSAPDDQCSKSDAPSAVKVMHQCSKSDAPQKPLNLVLVQRKTTFPFTARLVYSFCLAAVQEQQKRKQWGCLIPSMRAIAKGLQISQRATSQALKTLAELQLIDPDHTRLLTPPNGIFVERKGKGFPHWSSRIAYLQVDPPHKPQSTWRDMAVLYFLLFIQEKRKANNLCSTRYISASLGINQRTIDQTLAKAVHRKVMTVEKLAGFGFRFRIATTGKADRTN